MILGVGTGEHLNEGALGVQWPDNRERFARMREAVRLIRLLWTEQSVTFDGEYYHTRNATIYDRPEKPRADLHRRRGPQVAKYAGRAGDGLICTSGKGMELYSEQLLPSFNDGATESGRDPNELDRMIEVKVSYDTDANAPWRTPRSGPRWLYPPMRRPASTIRVRWSGLAKAVEDVAYRRWLVSNDPDEHIEQLRPYLDLGFNHLVFHSPGDGQARFLELYGSPSCRGFAKLWG